MPRRRLGRTRRSREFRLVLHRRRSVKVLLSVASTLLFFGTVELICRVLDLSDFLDADFTFLIRDVDDDLELDYMVEDPLLMWSPQPGYDHDGVTVNSAGFRDREYTVEKPRNTFRILCLGDSSTFGLGVMAADTYHSQLEQTLARQSAGSGRRYEVLNAGVTGYTSAQCLGMYVHRGQAWQPDVVTLYVGINDRHERSRLSDREIMREDLPVWFRKLTRSKLSKLVFFRVMRRLMTDVLSSDDEDEAMVPRVSLQEFAEDVLELNRRCRSAGSTLIAISPPRNSRAASESDLGPRVAQYRRTLQDTCDEHGIVLLHVEALTEASGQDNSHLFNDDVHPLPGGHKLLMQGLHDCLVAHDLLPR